MTDLEKAANSICEYIATDKAPKEVLEYIRNRVWAKTKSLTVIQSMFKALDGKRSKYPITYLGVARLLRDAGKEDEAFIFTTAAEVDEAERQERSDQYNAERSVHSFKRDHPIRGLFANKDKLKQQALDDLRLARLAKKDAEEQERAIKKIGKKELGLTENTIAQFFVDSGFIPPKGRNLLDLGFGFDSGIEADMEMDGYDGIPDTILDVTKDLDDGSEHPAPGIYADYYMFNDPGTRTEPDGGRSPISQQANQLNMEYHKKDLSRIESASDVHIESLEQPAGEFPRHAQVRSQMEPSVLGPEEVVLEQPTMIEGTVYPAGTRILAEGMVDLSQLQTTERDKLFESAGAKTCPLCHEPYEGDACPCVKNGQPEGKE